MRTKILLSFAVVFFITIVSNAQINKGSYLLGGSVSYYNGSNPTYESSYINVQFGTMIKDNSVIGIIGTYSSNNSNSTISSPNKTQSIHGGSFLPEIQSTGK